MHKELSNGVFTSSDLYWIRFGLQPPPSITHSLNSMFETKKTLHFYNTPRLHPLPNTRSFPLTGLGPGELVRKSNCKKGYPQEVLTTWRQPIWGGESFFLVRGFTKVIDEWQGRGDLL